MGRLLLWLVALTTALVVAGFVIERAPWPEEVRSSLQVTRGVAVLILLVLVVGAWLRRQRTSQLFTGDAPSPPRGSAERRHLDARWFANLHWLAAAMALGLISCAEMESRQLLLLWWAVLVLGSVGFELALQRWRSYEHLILAVACFDLVVLSGMLNASGGLENPLHTVFAFHVILGRILLPAKKAFAVTLLAMGLLGLLGFGEYFRLLPHYTNPFFPHPAPGARIGHGDHSAGVDHASYDLFFVLGRTVPFLGVLLLTDFFVAAVVARLRTSERGLRREARKSLLERERLEGVVDAAGVGMMQVGGDLTLRWFSGRIATWFGWGDEVNHRSCPLLEGAAGCESCVVRTTLETGCTATAERREVTADHGERYFRHSASPIKNPAGTVVQVVEVIEDVTAQRELEKEAIRAGKLSVLGRMAAGIAHEIGNPLSSISTRLQLLEHRRDEAYVAQSVEVLREQIARISRIVHGVSQFGRTHRHEHRRWPVDVLIAETVEVVELDLRAAGIRFRQCVAEPTPEVCAIRDQIGQIVLNLLLNAVEASPAGGIVTVGSQRMGDEVLIYVEDQGSGIEPRVRQRLFDPFVSTKSAGAGLGLSISFGFAVAHGGRIEAEDRPGGGARLVLHLPAPA